MVSGFFGGTFNEKLILYSNGWFDGCETPEQYAKTARATVEEGHTAIKMEGFRTLAPGEVVEFEVKKDQNGLKAINVTRTGKTAAAEPAPDA